MGKEKEEKGKGRENEKDKGKDKKENEKDKGKDKEKEKEDNIPDGDYEKGKKIFKQRCTQCHVIDSKSTKTGPTLNGVVGRKTGSVPGFDYSNANKNKGVVWSRETLFEYLEKPSKYIPGTKMMFPGLRKADQRADLIKYIEVESAKEPSS